MKHFAAVVAIIGIGSGVAFADSGTPDQQSALVSAKAPQPWSPQAGDEIRFDVFRQGDKKFGSHIVKFDSGQDGQLIVTSDVDLKAGLGPITLFRYSLDSVETWEEDRLVALDGQTNDDGDTKRVTASVKGNALEVNGSGYSGEVPLGIIPSSHWNIQQVFSKAILSTENGEILDTSVTRLGTDTIQINGKPVEATHYRLVSDLTVDLWYDDQNRWVQLSFEARGQQIDYRLSRLY